MRNNKQGKIQRFKCLYCNKRFTSNFEFEGKQSDSKIITGALQMYYSGMSVGDISTHYEFDTDVNHSTMNRWIAKYPVMLTRYPDEIIPRVGNWVRVDKV
ncbi:MAG: hypothetical protein R1F52_06915 [Candidatus Nitrosoabyssus spongiisocia]|nr:MAG: hypothetical protein R1F52_06915 [Nitrosopumilaceae archaeon AB1(1)]